MSCPRIGALHDRFFLHNRHNEYPGAHGSAGKRMGHKKLLPFSELNEAVISGIYETWDLAEYFELPESFIKTAVHYYVNCRGLKFNDKIAQI